MVSLCQNSWNTELLKPACNVVTHGLALLTRASSAARQCSQLALLETQN